MVGPNSDNHPHAKQKNLNRVTYNNLKEFILSFLADRLISLFCDGSLFVMGV
jgi:hypothetical protein